MMNDLREPNSKTVTAQLDYAPASPKRFRKRVGRAIFCIALVAVVVLGWQFGPRAFRQARLLYVQRQCLSYAGPSDRVVYDENSDSTADRLKQAGYSPLPARTGPVAVYIAPPLKGMTPVLTSSGIAGPKPGRGATVFMHEMRNAAGQRRLVLVERLPLSGMAPPFDYAFSLDVFMFEPGNWTKSPTFVGHLNGFDWNGPTSYPSTKGLRFYAGQIDPVDAGHFVIRYDLDGGSGVIDGWLNAAGDDVKIKIRSGPGMAPSPWTTQVGR